MAFTHTGLRYTESGRGAPLVLLDWTPWQSTRLASALASQYHVISVQPRAFGDTVESAREVLDSVAEIVETIGLDSYALLGVSVGADVCFRLALAYPTSVTTLVLVSSTCVNPAEPLAWNTPELAMNAMLAQPDASPVSQPDPAVVAALAELSEQWRAEFGDAADLLPDLSCATLVVFGQEDRLASREAGSVWKDRVPNCSICYVYDAGHAVGVDRPDALANVVLDFVERRETFVVEKRSALINP